MGKKVMRILLVLAALLILTACGTADDGIPFSGGSGTESDPYRISTAEDLWELAELVNAKETQNDYLGAHYLLTADIDLGGKKEWMPIGYYAVNENYFRFAGVFDGDGHAVSGICINYKDPVSGNKRSAFGLFGELEGTVKNLTIRNSVITAEGEGSICAGAVAGDMNGGVIENCHADDTVSISGTYNVGGICGSVRSDFPVKGCSNAATVTATSQVGMAAGIVAYGDCAVIECSNAGTISSAGEAAGICGNANKGIRGCSNSGNVQAESHAAGIIYSFDDGALNSDMNDASITLERCINTGNVTSTGRIAENGIALGRAAGGIAVGCRTGSVKDCVNSGNVTAGAEAGGILAYFQKSAFGTPCETFVVSGCENSGAVTSTGAGYAVGGICGSATGDETKIRFENCVNSGMVMGIGMKDVANGGCQAGGILGYGGYISELYFADCVNSGAVQGSDEAGGIAGFVNSSREKDGFLSATRCSNSGSVYATNSRGLTQEIYAGGIIGCCKTVGNDVNPSRIKLEMEACTNTGVLDGDRDNVNLCTDDLCASNNSQLDKN